MCEKCKNEKAKNRVKQIKKNKAGKRKIRKGGVFEVFERETGMQEETNNNLIYAFLDYILSDNKNRKKLKELTDIHIKEQGIDVDEMKNLYDEKYQLGRYKSRKSKLSSNRKKKG